MRQRHPFLILALAVVALAIPLLWYITPTRNDIDLLFYKIVLGEFSDQFWHGDLYPRWLGRVNDGLGGPVFLFHGPVTFYLTSLLQWLHGVDTNGTLRFILSITAARIAAGWLCYLWLMKHCKATHALIAALLYVTIPYAFHQLYISPGLSSQWAMVCVFIMFICLDRLLEQKAFSIAYLSVASALLIMTHVLTFATFAWVPFLYIYFLAQPQRRWLVLGQVLLALILSIVLSAIYLLPLWLNKPYLQASSVLLSGKYDFSHNFLGSNEISCLPYFGIAVLALYYTKVYVQKVPPPVSLPFDAPFLRFQFAVILVATFFLLPVSLPLWRALPPLQYLQFPFRFLNILLPPFACMAAIFACNARYRPMILILWGAALLVNAYVVFPRAGDDEKAVQKMAECKMLLFPELATQWNHDSAMIEKVARNDYTCGQGRTRLTSGEGALVALNSVDGNLRVDVTVTKPATLVLARYYFPGAYVQDIKTKKTFDLSPSEPDGLQSVNLAPGNYSLEAGFGDFAGERLGSLISLLGVAIVLLIAFIERKCARAY